MKSLIHYQEIKELKNSELLMFLADRKKLKFGDITFTDLQINSPAILPNKKITDKNWEQSLFGYGVYVVFDATKPIYAGKVIKHFLHRFLSHRTFDGRKEYAFNELARQVAKNKLKNINLALNKKSFENKVIPEMEKLFIVWVNCYNVLTTKQCDRLERILRKGLHNPPINILYNGLRTFKGYDSDKTIHETLIG